MSKEALRNQLQRVRAELNHLSNMIELTPEPDPEPDPEPSPDHQNSIFGWNLGWQNYWSTCRLIDDIVYPQTYTIKDDGEPYEFTKSGVMISGTSTFQMNADPAVLKPGRYIYKNNLLIQCFIIDKNSINQKVYDSVWIFLITYHREYNRMKRTSNISSKNSSHLVKGEDKDNIIKMPKAKIKLKCIINNNNSSK